jgi:hypothetical protein
MLTRALRSHKVPAEMEEAAATNVVSENSVMGGREQQEDRFVQ